MIVQPINVRTVDDCLRMLEQNPGQIAVFMDGDLSGEGLIKFEHFATLHSFIDDDSRITIQLQDGSIDVVCEYDSRRQQAFVLASKAQASISKFEFMAGQEIEPARQQLPKRAPTKFKLKPFTFK